LFEKSQIPSFCSKQELSVLEIPVSALKSLVLIQKSGIFSIFKQALACDFCTVRIFMWCKEYKASDIPAGQVYRRLLEWMFCTADGNFGRPILSRLTARQVFGKSRRL